MPMNSWRATATTLRAEGSRSAAGAGGGAATSPAIGSAMQRLHGGPRPLFGHQAHEDLFDAGQVGLEGGDGQPALDDLPQLLAGGRAGAEEEALAAAVPAHDARHRREPRVVR